MVFIFPLSGACLKPFGTFPSHIPQASQRLGKTFGASVPLRLHSQQHRVGAQARKDPRPGSQMPLEAKTQTVQVGALKIKIAYTMNT